MASALFQGSKHALLYSKFRPSPPPLFIKNIISYLKSKVKSPLKIALDIGCGSGQSTIVLSPYFENVVGLDVSEAQIECAKITHSSSNIQYRVSACENLPFSSSSIDLVTLCQSVHWFNTQDLFSEVHRILIPGGVIAICGYWVPLPKVNNDEKNKQIKKLIMQDLHENTLGEFWDKERYLVQNHYADIDFPFNDVQRMDLVQKYDSSILEYIGYLSTWSSFQKLCRKDYRRGKEILEYVQKQLISILNEDKSSEQVMFTLHTDFFMKIGRH